MDFIESLRNYLDQSVVDKLLNSLNEETTHCLLINTNKIDENYILSTFKSLKKHPFINNAFYYDKNIDEPGKNFLFDNGAYYIIDASSLLVGHFLDVQDGDLVLDMCAAPGGKSISVLLKSKKIVEICNDLSKTRAFSMAQNFERLGFDNTVVCSNDFSLVYKNFLNTFDKIILDAPCSGSGMFRKNNNMKLDWNIEKVKKLSVVQKKLLDIAFKMLKPNGIISYSTCSFNYEENEEVILDFISKNEDAELITIPSFEGEFRTDVLKEAIHLFPCFYKGEGMFICQIRKKDQNVSYNYKKAKIKNKTTYQKKFNLDYKYEEIINDFVFVHNIDLDLSSLYLLSKGLNIGEIRKSNFLPSFHLAHFLPSTSSIELNDDEAKKYIHGDVINLTTKKDDGYYIVSYKNINLGYVKSVKNVLKNFYPKGLRH